MESTGMRAPTQKLSPEKSAYQHFHSEKKRTEMRVPLQKIISDDTVGEPGHDYCQAPPKFIMGTHTKMQQTY